MYQIAMKKSHLTWLAMGIFVLSVIIMSTMLHMDNIEYEKQIGSEYQSYFECINSAKGSGSAFSLVLIKDICEPILTSITDSNLTFDEALEIKENYKSLLHNHLIASGIIYTIISVFLFLCLKEKN